jgi:hypothetical protein
MRRSFEQLRLLAICKKLDEVVDGLGDDDCVALVNAIGKVVKANERAPAAPDFDSTSLAELLAPTSVGVKKKRTRTKRQKKVDDDNDEDEEEEEEGSESVVATPPRCSSGGKGSSIKKAKKDEEEKHSTKQSMQSLSR